MAERVAIVRELKRALKERGLTYADVARTLRLSLASVKRLFSSGDLSLARVDAVCELAGISLREILERAEEHAIPGGQLTLTQEREIVSDPRLLFVTWLVLNRMQFEQIVRDYRLTEAEVLGCLIKLDQLKVIELQPFNRTRLLVSRYFSWRPGGPVQRYINGRLLREFMSTRFSGAQEEFIFHGAPTSTTVLAQIKRVLQRTARECMELIERDRSPPQQRRGAAFVLAMRPWEYSGFAPFRREGEAPAPVGAVRSVKE
ncbi:MAG: helix-turn-helix transcriptional regulator [Proteobacteria bacterium]|nr:helix-turn-helix transcriptional regulator [Pseudomonadota bacterium]